MTTTKGWEYLEKLSSILRDFSKLYIEADDADEDGRQVAIVEWRQGLTSLFKNLLVSCGSGSQESSEDLWLHFDFSPFCSVLSHSCCDWFSREAFLSGLASEVTTVLLQVQSELPISTPAIVYVLLHRLATRRANREDTEHLDTVVTSLEQALDSCPAMPGAVLETSVEACLRRSFPGITGSSTTVGSFTGVVLMLVTRAPRSLGSVIVPLLVRFVAETSCGAHADADDDCRSSLACKSCAIARASPDIGEDGGQAPRTRLCDKQRKRDTVLRSLLHWVADAHFRQCSRVLQISLYRTVLDGVQQTMEASATAASWTASSSAFPVACRLLLAFVGTVAGDGGAHICSFLQDRCRLELRALLAGLRSRQLTSTQLAHGQAAHTRFPMLQAYVGHLCLCRHIQDSTAREHLLWLIRQTLAVFRLVEGDDHTEAMGGRHGRRDYLVALRDLCHAVALVLTRPTQQQGASAAVPEGGGELLEIIFDSEARPLAGLPRPLAINAVGILKRAGHLQLARTGALLGPSPKRPCSTAGVTSWQDEPSRECYSSDFRGAPIAFKRSWSFAAAGLRMEFPSLRPCEVVESEDDDSLVDEDGVSPQDQVGDAGARETPSSNQWDLLPEEAVMVVLSFLTPKRICRLTCVDRAWRDLAGLPRIWRPFFEARWSPKALENEQSLAEVTNELVGIRQLHGDRPGRRHMFVKTPRVYFWAGQEARGGGSGSVDWCTLYRNRHRAEVDARRLCARTEAPWRVCPFLGCGSLLKSGIKQHMKTHKRPRQGRGTVKRSRRLKGPSQ